MREEELRTEISTFKQKIEEVNKQIEETMKFKIDRQLERINKEN